MSLFNINLQLFGGGGSKSGLGGGGDTPSGKGGSKNGNEIYHDDEGYARYLVIYIDKTGKKRHRIIAAKSQSEANKKAISMRRLNKDIDKMGTPSAMTNDQVRNYKKKYGDV